MIITWQTKANHISATHVPTQYSVLSVVICDTEATQGSLYVLIFQTSMTELSTT